MRYKDVVTYLNGRYLSGTSGPKYNLQQALFAAATGTRFVYDTTNGLRPILIGTDVRPGTLGDWPAEMAMLYGPAGMGIVGSKFIGGNGMMGIPGLKINSKLKLPFIKL